MTPGTESASEQSAFREKLLAEKLLIDTGADGLYGHGPVFTAIIEGLAKAITAAGAGTARDVMRFPPVLRRSVLEIAAYIKSFPHLTGSVYAFDERSGPEQLNLLLEHIEAGEPYQDSQDQTDLALAPSACYHVYGQYSGTLPEGGVEADVENLCFRREPSPDPARMQSFRMREFVRIGEPGAIREWRDDWLDKGLAFLTSLGLDAQVAPASDPFFGETARFMRAQQKKEALKFELLTPATSRQKLTAVMSCNCHHDHFADPFGIRLHTGEPAHSACVGFGMERLTLALLFQHGTEIEHWPPAVRSMLSPEG